MHMLPWGLNAELDRCSFFFDSPSGKGLLWMACLEGKVTGTSELLQLQATVVSLHWRLPRFRMLELHACKHLQGTGCSIDVWHSDSLCAVVHWQNAWLLEQYWEETFELYLHRMKPGARKRIVLQGSWGSMWFYSQSLRSYWEDELAKYLAMKERGGLLPNVSQYGLLAAFFQMHTCSLTW